MAPGPRALTGASSHSGTRCCRRPPGTLAVKLLKALTVSTSFEERSPFCLTYGKISASPVLRNSDEKEQHWKAKRARFSCPLGHSRHVTLSKYCGSSEPRLPRLQGGKTAASLPDGRGTHESTGDCQVVFVSFPIFPFAVSGSPDHLLPRERLTIILSYVFSPL